MSIEIAEVKEDVFDLKNDLNPKVKTPFDADKVRHDDTTELKQVCRKQGKKLRRSRIKNNPPGKIVRQVAYNPVPNLSKFFVPVRFLPLKTNRAIIENNKNF